MAHHHPHLSSAQLAKRDAVEEIKKKLIDKDMTQVELAEQLGVTKQYITKIITGTRTGDKYLCRIGAILDIDIAKFAA